jgi:hypothetical protein
MRTDGVKLVLVHLYPELMNVYGDRGNILRSSVAAAGAGSSSRFAAAPWASSSIRRRST